MKRSPFSFSYFVLFFFELFSIDPYYSSSRNRNDRKGKGTNERKEIRDSLFFFRRKPQKRESHGIIIIPLSRQRNDFVT